MQHPDDAAAVVIGADRDIDDEGRGQTNRRAEQPLHRVTDKVFRRDQAGREKDHAGQRGGVVHVQIMQQQEQEQHAQPSGPEGRGGREQQAAGIAEQRAAEHARELDKPLTQRLAERGLHGDQRAEPGVKER